MGPNTIDIKQTIIGWDGDIACSVNPGTYEVLAKNLDHAIIRDTDGVPVKVKLEDI